LHDDIDAGLKPTTLGRARFGKKHRALNNVDGVAEQ
jgi:hypothetical protein